MEKERSSGELELAGINDKEIASYLCSQKEMQLRKLMWEILNGDYLKGKRVEQAIKSKKKAPPPKKPLKIYSGQIEKKKTSAPASSKINYDALKELMEDQREETPTSCKIGEDDEHDGGGDRNIGDYYNGGDNAYDFDF